MNFLACGVSFKSLDQKDAYCETNAILPFKLIFDQITAHLLEKYLV